MREPDLTYKKLIISAEEKLLYAIKNCDIQKLEDLLHDDLLFNIPTGETITKAMDLENYRSGNMNVSEISSSEQKISIIENNALVSATIKMEGTYLKHALDGKYKIIRIWRLFNDDWKVIAGSSVRL